MEEESLHQRNPSECLSWAFEAFFDGALPDTFTGLRREVTVGAIVSLLRLFPKVFFEFSADRSNLAAADTIAKKLIDKLLDPSTQDLTLPRLLIIEASKTNPVEAHVKALIPGKRQTNDSLGEKVVVLADSTIPEIGAKVLSREEAYSQIQHALGEEGQGYVFMMGDRA
jgi:hypothetical protein